MVRSAADLNTTSVTQSCTLRQRHRERCIVYLCILNATPSAASLISDIPHDMNDVLKACVCHHPSFGVNLKVAALWMSTPSHVDLFKCHRSLFCNCGAGQTKAEGAAKEGRETCWHMSFFFFLQRKAKWHTISPAQQVFHLALEEEYEYLVWLFVGCATLVICSLTYIGR